MLEHAVSKLEEKDMLLEEQRQALIEGEQERTLRAAEVAGLTERIEKARTGDAFPRFHRGGEGGVFSWKTNRGG